MPIEMSVKDNKTLFKGTAAEIEGAVASLGKEEAAFIRGALMVFLATGAESMDTSVEEQMDRINTDPVLSMMVDNSNGTLKLDRE